MTPLFAFLRGIRAPAWCGCSSLFARYPKGAEMEGFAILAKARDVFALISLLAKLEKVGTIKLCTN